MAFDVVATTSPQKSVARNTQPQCNPAQSFLGNAQGFTGALPSISGTSPPLRAIYSRLPTNLVHVCLPVGRKLAPIFLRTVMQQLKMDHLRDDSPPYDVLTLQGTTSLEGMSRL